MKLIQETLKKFDEKYGRFIPCETDCPWIYTREILEKGMTGLVEKLSKEIDGMHKEQLDKNDPDNYGACYAIGGFNDAINKIKEKLIKDFKLK